ncbi:hypothetical protein LGQ02_10255 [Bacillus shivajii]|nr:hypothetical protein [Bacillus shivajii]UCZ55074.1 hypothetical protein LGQ02_10255 [Bacillus shivajii]
MDWKWGERGRNIIIELAEYLAKEVVEQVVVLTGIILKVKIRINKNIY